MESKCVKGQFCVPTRCMLCVFVQVCHLRSCVFEYLCRHAVFTVETSLGLNVCNGALPPLCVSIVYTWNLGNSFEEFRGNTSVHKENSQC